MPTKSVTSASQLPVPMDRQELEPFLKKAQVYRVQNDSNASQSQFLVELPHFIQRGGEEKYLASNYFWGDGKNFYQLRTSGEATTGTRGGILSGHVNLDRPGHEKMDLVYAGSQAQVVECKNRWDIEALEEVSADMLASANFFALPVKDEPQYLARLPDGRSLLVTAPAPEFSYDFRVFLGSAGKMAEVEVNSVIRFYDGGTTYIDTTAGLFYFPTFQKSTFTPSGSDTVVPLMELDPSKNEIATADLGVSLRKYAVDSQRFICDE